MEAGLDDADPVAACVREIVAERTSWTGSAADLLRAGAGRSINGTPQDRTGWPTNARALAGRLRRAQTFLRALGIDIAFSREGRAGSRIIRIRATQENTVSTVSTVSIVRDHGRRATATGPLTRDETPRPSGEICHADDADGADANVGYRFG